MTTAMNGSPIQGSNETAVERRLVAAHLQGLEANALDGEDIAMFEMFERERWPSDRRRAYIRERALIDSLVHAAE